MKKKIQIQQLIFKYLVVVASFGLLFSCDGFHDMIVPVNVPVENVGRVLVINAQIQKDLSALVQLSYSEDIDESITTPVNYENGASITIKSGDGQTEVLKLAPSNNGWYYGTTIKGKVSETYTLTITVNGETYTATSTMIPPRGYKSAWVNMIKGKSAGSVYYSDEWVVNDPSATRNRYLFEWWRNGVHEVWRDWSIDDNRVVNANEGLRLFNVTTDPGANEHTMLRVAEIDKVTYDYYNMYEKIVRGLVSVASQTPYNPVSNFGKGTIGNFRAVAFMSVVILTPPAIAGIGQNGQNVIAFPINSRFPKYNLYWSNSSGVTKNSTKISNITVNKSGNSGTFAHKNLTNGTKYYYCIEVEDAEGNVSVLSPEVNVAPDPNVPADDNAAISGKAPTNVKAIAGSGLITLMWDKVTGVDGYVIYWSSKPGVTASSNIITDGTKGGLVSPYTHTGLAKGQPYYYRVASYIGKDVFLADEISATPN